MNYRFKSLIALSFLCSVFCVNAESIANSYDHAELKNKVEASSGLQVQSVSDAPVQGLLQLNTQRGIFYASEDGTYLLQARIYNLDEQMRNETESALTDVRLQGLAQFENDTIDFKAKNEKYVVSIFTDVTCGYCRKLHEQMAEYNDAGITVRYLAFPRAGLDSPIYDEMVSVWCSADPQKALTDSKSSREIASAKCENSIAEQYKFGQQIGVNGTPNIVLPDGSLIPGYQPAPQLLQALQNAG